jgi:DNA-binding response OmpR family regulator
MLLLIVEDDDDLRDTLSVMLELRGHRVLAAPDGASALELAARVHPRAALVDLGLPDISGHEVARRLRASPGLAPILLIALTGFSAEAERIAAMEAGFDEFLVKPVWAAELERVLGGAL